MLVAAALLAWAAPAAASTGCCATTLRPLQSQAPAYAALATRADQPAASAHAPRTNDAPPPCCQAAGACENCCHASQTDRQHDTPQDQHTQCCDDCQSCCAKPAPAATLSGNHTLPAAPTRARSTPPTASPGVNPLDAEAPPPKPTLS